MSAFQNEKEQTVYQANGMVTTKDVRQISFGISVEISFTAEGGGFLTLDRNKDRNGWIDEADVIFKELYVWAKDADGRDYLMSHKETDIGAIYLGKAVT